MKVEVISTISLLLLLSARSCLGLPKAAGVNFIGIGYNILEGNPEGGDLSSGGVDPGLLVGRRAFTLSYNEGRTTSDGAYLVPDECEFIHRSSAYTSTSYSTFYGTESYQSKLSAQVAVSGAYSGLFASVEFAASTRYENIASRTSSQGSVFFASETITNNGHARYRTELAEPDQYSLENGFAASACDLPNTYSETAYMNFLNDWGTHVVTEVDLGTRTGENREESRSSFVTYASTSVGASVSASGSYGGYSASLSVNMDTFQSSLNSGMSFGSEYSSYAVGSAALNEPISATMITMNEVFQEKYWTRLNEYIASGYCDSDWTRSSVESNILTALQGFAAWRNIQASTNPSIIIPLTWPDGNYGLPKPSTGCPGQFTWIEGSRKHDTEDDNSNNQWSSTLHLDGWWGRNNMEHRFCMKTTSNVDSNTWIWQPGSYCIYKYGSSCPADFTESTIYYDDEDDSNANTHSGTLPAGSYGSNTRYYFCCRSDGVVDNAIYLPTDRNFILFPRYNACQQVNGMSVTQEWFRWDNEDDNNRDSQSAVHPYQGLQSSGHNVVLHFCYYY